MAAPNNQFDLGTLELNGRDGDTAREAGEKYNTHTHQTANAQAAIDNADAPTTLNPFITESALDTALTGYLSVGQNLAEVDDVEDARSNLGLGTAALLDGGSGIGDALVIVDVGGAVAGLPAIDGSQLLNLPGGGGGGFETVVMQFTQAGPLGPSYTTDNSPPDPLITLTGSVHLDADDEEIYYRDSTGWQGPFAAPGSPITFSDSGPYPWVGSPGDYWCNTSELEFYGPRGADWGLATSIPGWTLIEVMADPVIGDGSEGDWAWQDMGGGVVKLWGPKTDTGWPTDYSSFTGIDTATPEIYMSAPLNGNAASDEIWVRPGTGQVQNSFTTVPTDNAYTLTRLINVDTGETIGASKLIIGAELESTAVTYALINGDRIQAYPLIESSPIDLGREFTPNWLSQPSVGSTTGKAILKGSGAGGDMYLKIRYGSNASFHNVSDVDFTLTLYYLSGA